MIFHRAKFKTTRPDVVMQNSALTGSFHVKSPNS